MITVSKKIDEDVNEKKEMRMRGGKKVKVETDPKKKLAAFKERYGSDWKQVLKKKEKSLKIARKKAHTGTADAKRKKADAKITTNLEKKVANEVMIMDVAESFILRSGINGEEFTVDEGSVIAMYDTKLGREKLDIYDPNGDVVAEGILLSSEASEALATSIEEGVCESVQADFEEVEEEDEEEEVTEGKKCKKKKEVDEEDEEDEEDLEDDEEEVDEKVVRKAVTHGGKTVIKKVEMDPKKRKALAIKRLGASGYKKMLRALKKARKKVKGSAIIKRLKSMKKTLKKNVRKIGKASNIKALKGYGLHGAAKHKAVNAGYEYDSRVLMLPESYEFNTSEGVVEIPANSLMEIVECTDGTLIAMVIDESGEIVAMDEIDDEALATMEEESIVEDFDFDTDELDSIDEEADDEDDNADEEDTVDEGKKAGKKATKGAMSDKEDEEDKANESVVLSYNPDTLKYVVEANGEVGEFTRAEVKELFVNEGVEITADTFIKARREKVAL